MSDVRRDLFEAIGLYGAIVATTGELAPSAELIAAIDAAVAPRAIPPDSGDVWCNFCNRKHAPSTCFAELLSLVRVVVQERDAGSRTYLNAAIDALRPFCAATKEAR